VCVTFAEIRSAMLPHSSRFSLVWPSASVSQKALCWNQVYCRTCV